MAEAYSTTTDAMVSFDFWGAPIYEDSRGDLYCPGFTGDTYAANPWDYVLMYGLSEAVASPLSALAGPVKTPGIAKVDARKGAAIDRKKAAGSNGETITVHGLNAGDISIALLIWTPQQLKVLRAIWKNIFSPTGKLIPAVVQVVHPSFTEAGISAIQLTGTLGWTDGPVPRSKVFTMQAVEFFPPTKHKSVTKTQTAPKGTLIDPNAHPTPGSDPKNANP